MCLWISVVLVFVVAVVTLAFIYLPLWGALLVLLGLVLVPVFGFKWIMAKIVERVFIGLFDSKSRVLRDATAVVHSVKSADAPEPSDDYINEDEEGDPPRVFYTVEATITPKGGASTPFGLWDTIELMMVSYDTKVTKSADDIHEDECAIRGIRVFEDGQYKEMQESKVGGERRLEVLVGVKPGIKRLKFRYYFETFGDVRLP